MEKHSLQVTKDTPITQEIPRVVGVLCHFLGGEGFVKDRIYFVIPQVCIKMIQDMLI